MGKKKTTGKRNSALVIMALLGFLLQISPVISYPHEVGHLLMAKAVGGNAHIVDAKNTHVDSLSAKNPLVRAAGYSLEMWIWMIIMLVTVKGSKFYSLALGGMIGTIRMGFASTDLHGYPGGTAVFLVVVAIAISLVIWRNRRRIAPQEAPKYTRVTVSTKQLDGSILVRHEKRPYTGSEREVVFQNVRR